MKNSPETSSQPVSPLSPNKMHLLRLQTPRSPIREVFDPSLITPSKKIEDDAEPWLLSEK